MKKQPNPVTRHIGIKGLTPLLALCLTMFLLAGCSEQPSSIIRPLPPELVGGSGSSSSAGGDAPESSQSAGEETPESSPSAGKDTPPPSGIDWSKRQDIADSADVSLLLEQVTLDDAPLKFPFTVNEVWPEYTVTFVEESYTNSSGTVEGNQYTGTVNKYGIPVCTVYTEDYTPGKEGDAKMVGLMSFTNYMSLRVCGIGEGDTTEEMYAALGVPARIAHSAGEAYVFYRNATQRIVFIAARKKDEWIINTLLIEYKKEQ